MVLQRFEEKTALITGGGGMGRAVALRLLSEGGRVLVTDYSQDILARLKQEFDELGYSDRTRFLLSDVRIYRDCCVAVQKGVEWFGKIDILVTTAGILRHHPIDLLTEKDWKDVVDVNLTGTYNSVKSVAGHMKDRRYGRIVLISSIGGRTGPSRSGGELCGDERRRRRDTQLLGYELGPWNITVNCVAPGPIGGGMFTSLPAKEQERLLEGIRLGRDWNL